MCETHIFHAICRCSSRGKPLDGSTHWPLAHYMLWYFVLSLLRLSYFTPDCPLIFSSSYRFNSSTSQSCVHTVHRSSSRFLISFTEYNSIPYIRSWSNHRHVVVMGKESRDKHIHYIDTTQCYVIILILLIHSATHPPGGTLQ